MRKKNSHLFYFISVIISIIVLSDAFVTIIITIVIITASNFIIINIITSKDGMIITSKKRYDNDQYLLFLAVMIID